MNMMISSLILGCQFISHDLDIVGAARELALAQSNHYVTSIIANTIKLTLIMGTPIKLMRLRGERFTSRGWLQLFLLVANSLIGIKLRVKNPYVGIGMKTFLLKKETRYVLNYVLIYAKYCTST